MTVGLLGPNGAGKTTLIRVCAGWLTPDQGMVWVDGQRQALMARAARMRLGVVSRDAPLYNELTVMETLSLHATLYGLDADQCSQICRNAITEYRLQEIATRRIGVLSTGMLQRVAIATAMLHQPAVLLLDEPTVGLDPDVRHHIWECLARLRRHGVAILLTTHYLEEAAYLCDTVHLLVNGGITATIAPSTVDGPAALERAFLSAIAPPKALDSAQTR